MKIEEGRCYVARNGDVVGPIEINDSASPDVPLRGTVHSFSVLYDREGKRNGNGGDDPWDLVGPAAMPASKA